MTPKISNFMNPSELSFVKDQIAKFQEKKTVRIKDEYIFFLKKAYDVRFKSFLTFGIFEKEDYLITFSFFVHKTL